MRKGELEFFTILSTSQYAHLNTYLHLIIHGYVGPYCISWGYVTYLKKYIGFCVI